MATADVTRVVPASPAEAAEALRSAAAAGQAVRPSGGGTKLGWGNVVEAPPIELSTGALDAIVEHNEGDLTAILQAGVPLARAQEAFGAAGQMLAVDPPWGAGDAATIGGVVSTADSGPLRHRYHAVRDLVLGAQVALTDGSTARAGSKVIKNVAGYDLAKLLTGAHGTLGVLCEVSVRLHPLPVATATARADGEDPRALALAAGELARLPLEHVALDLAWADGAGSVLARFAGATAAGQAARAVSVLTEAGLDARVEEDDDPLWQAQRAGQRAPDAARTVVRVAGTLGGLPAALAEARRLGARAVARGGLGTAWLTLPAAEDDAVVAAVGELRAALAPALCVVADAPAGVRGALDPWDAAAPATLDLMRRVKARFDPHGTCNPGVFVGGL